MAAPRFRRTRRSAIAIIWGVSGLLLTGCTVFTRDSEATPTPCPGVPVVASAADAAGDIPDLSRFGFPQVAATKRFTPGQATQIEAGGIAVNLPADLYTDPLDFELLTGDPTVWQSCVGTDTTLLTPYAYRVTNPVNGQRIGKFDKPVTSTVSDSRITAQASYWIVNPSNPPSALAISGPVIDGSTLTATNSSALIGWFLTVPRQAP